VSQPKPSDAEALSGALVMYASRLVRAVSRRTSRDVPAASLRLLSQVDELGPTGISQLAAADRCSQPTMSSGVQNLADKGWVVKLPNPADARSCLVQITDAGLAALGDTRRKNAEVVAERLHADPRHDVDDLRRAVDLLQHLLEDHPLEDHPDESGANT
jgi:DNA-binding MarR family transcriptional regulator